MFKNLFKQSTTKDKQDENKDDLKINKSLEKNIQLFKSVFYNDDTLVIRNFENESLDIKCCIFYIDGMVNNETVNENIIQPIMRSSIDFIKNDNCTLDEVQRKIIVANHVIKTTDVNKIIDSITYGDTAFFIEGSDSALIIETKGWQTRAITEPTSESVVRGPHEGFTESILMNLSLIRRKINTPDLKFIYMNIGRQTKTKICICYIDNIAEKKILDELLERLNKIDIDGILDSGYIQELIKDAPLSPFKTIGDTERPDVVAGKLLEGRFGIIVDGSPNVLTLPSLFMEYFQSSEDYYGNYIHSSFNRLVRIVGATVSVSVTPFYIALVVYHQEMIPTPLLISISSARRHVPFPTAIEAVVLLFIFEVLREVGTRIPPSIGQSVSIVGALVLGQAAVDARLVSAPIIIVVALTGITSLLIPKAKGTLIITRILLLILTFVFGLYGFVGGISLAFIYLMSIRSFGVPYMLNIASIEPQHIKDTAIRAPWFYMYTRPQLLSQKNYIRQKPKK